MVVTLTVASLAASLRLGDTPEETTEATRLLGYATEAVTRHSPDAPDVVHNEAAIRVVGYLFDMPTAARGDGYADVVRNSGASRILLPYRTHRAGSTADDTVSASDDDERPARVGDDDVDVRIANTWTLTSIPIPTTAFFAYNVVYPDGTLAGIEIVDFEFATDAPVIIGDPAQVPANREFGFGRVGGSVAFASHLIGSHQLTIYEVPW